MIFPVLELNVQVGLLCAAISKRLDGRPYAFLGHSLGGMLAYDVAREMIRRNNPAPIHVCISSVLPPSHANFKCHGGPMSELSDAEFMTQAKARCWLKEIKDREGQSGIEFGDRRRSVHDPQSIILYQLFPYLFCDYIPS